MNSTRGLSLAGLLNDSIAKWVGEHVYTALPGRVERFDEAKNAVDVKPLIKNPIKLEDGSPALETLQVIPNVPLMQFGMGGMRITFPATQGDTVLLVFARRSIDKWKSYGGDVDPSDSRMFNLTDAVAIPGLLPFASPWTGTSRTDMTMGKDSGPQVIFKGDSIHLGGDNATEHAVLGDSFKTAVTNFATSVATAATTMGGTGTPAPVTQTQAAAFAVTVTTAVTALNAALALALSQIVKVK